MNKKSLTELLIALNECNRKLDRIKNDPEYIQQKTKEVFGKHEKKDRTEEIKAILDAFS